MPRRWPVIATAVALLGALALLRGGMAAWLGVAALAMVAGDLWRALPPLARARVLVALPYAVVAGLFILLLGELLLGRAPASRDHSIHYFQTRVFVDEFVPSGRFTGWSDRLNNGFPIGESYPSLGYAVTGAAHLVSFGLVPLRASYAFGIAAIWGLGTFAAWRLASAIASEFSQSRTAIAWAGCIGATLWLLDPGESRQGGWDYAMFHGVWPQMLSTSLWVLSLTSLWSALRKPNLRACAIAAAWLGASVAAHPFGLLTAVASALGWLLVLTFSPRRSDAPPGRLLVWLGTHLAAGWLAIGWLVVFFRSTDAMERVPVPWEPLREIAAQMLTGELLGSHWAIATVLVLIGIIAVARRGRLFGWLILGLIVGLLLLGSHEATTLLRLDLLVSGVKNLQFPRYMIALRPLLYGLGGAGLIALLVALPRPRHSRRVPYLHRFLGALVLAPLLVGVLEGGERVVQRPVGGVDTLQSSPQAEVEGELASALRREQASLPAGVPMTVAFLRRGMGGGTYPIMTIADLDAKLVIDGHIPTINFRYYLLRSPAVFSTLGVTHILHDDDFGARDRGFPDLIEFVGAYGKYRLQRIRSPNAATIVECDGCTAAVASRSAESLTVVATDVQGSATLKFRMPPHLRWTAMVDGEAAALAEASDPQGMVRSRLVVHRDAEVRLAYARPKIEFVARWASIFATLLVGVCLFRRRPLALPRQLELPQVRSAIAGVVALAVLAAAVFVLLRQRDQLRTTWLAVGESLATKSGERAPVFVRDLTISGSMSVEMAPERVCDGLLGRSGLSGCSEAAHRPNPALMYRHPFLYRCVEVTVPAGGETTVDLGAAGTAVIGTVVRQHLIGRGNHLRYAPADRLQDELGNRRDDFWIRAGEPPRLRLSNVGLEPERVCVAAAEVQPSGPTPR